jgi:hypothetical protein
MGSPWVLFPQGTTDPDPRNRRAQLAVCRGARRASGGGGPKTAHLLGLSAPWPPRHANPDKEKFVHPCSLGNSGQGRVRALCAPYRAHALSRVARSGAEDDQQAELNFRADCKSPSCFRPRAQPAAAWGFGTPVRPRCSAGRRRGYCLAAGSTTARERPRFPDWGTAAARSALAGVVGLTLSPGPIRGLCDGEDTTLRDPRAQSHPTMRAGPCWQRPRTLGGDPSYVRS